MKLEDVERRIGCDLTKNPRREETKTPMFTEQCKTNPKLRKQLEKEKMECKRENEVQFTKSGTAVM